MENKRSLSKITTKIISVLLAVLMVCAFTVPALAESPYSITIVNENPAISIKDCKFSAYKLFDVTYSDTDNDGNLDAFVYTIPVYNQFYSDAAAKAIIEKYFTLTPVNGGTMFNVVPKSDGFDARTFGDEMHTVLNGKTPDAMASAYSQTVTLNGRGFLSPYISAGYYIVIGSAKNSNKTVVNAAVALTTTEPTATIYVKADAPTINKTVGEDNKTSASYDVGDTVPFTVISNVPVTTSYSIYKYTVHDNMSDGLTLNENSINVTIGEKTLVRGVDYTVNTSCTDDCTFEIQIDDLLVKENGVRKYNDGDAVTVTYTALLNERSLTRESETNTTTLEFSNNPYDTSSTGTTPQSRVCVYDFEIDVDKYTNHVKDDNTNTGGEPVLVPGKEYVFVSNRENGGWGIEYAGDGAYFFKNFEDITPNDMKLWVLRGTLDENYHLIFDRPSSSHFAKWAFEGGWLNDNVDFYIVPLDSIEPIPGAETGIRLTSEPVIHIERFADLDWVYDAENQISDGDLSDYVSYIVPGTEYNEFLRLPGAKFVLLNEQGKFYKYADNDVQWVDNIGNADVVITDENGLAQFRGLKEGTYFLRETEAPDGYNVLTEDIRVDLTAIYDKYGNIDKLNSDVVLTDTNADDEKDAYVKKVLVENRGGHILPSTGGIGIYILYITGCVLVLNAMIVLLFIRRKNKYNN